MFASVIIYNYKVVTSLQSPFPTERGHVYLHELLEGSELILPVFKPAKRVGVHRLSTRSLVDGSKL